MTEQAYLELQNRLRGLLAGLKSRKFVKNRKVPLTREFRSGLREQLVAVRATLTPDRYDEFLSWTRHQIETQAGELGHTPIDYDELTGVIHAPAVSLERELQWITARIINGSELINSSRSFSQNIEALAWVGDAQSAIQMLDVMNASIGVTLWAVPTHCSRTGNKRLRKPEEVCSASPQCPQTRAARLRRLAFARIGATLGNGSAEEITALGDFFLALGTAYQTIDDVINVAGLHNNAKERGEDLRTGRITLPVVHFLRAAAQPQRKNLLAEFQAATTDAPTHARLLNALAGSGVLELCRSQTRHAVRSELQALERFFPRSELQTLDQFATLVIEDYY